MNVTIETPTLPNGTVTVQMGGGRWKSPPHSYDRSRRGCLEDRAHGGQSLISHFGTAVAAIFAAFEDCPFYGSSHIGLLKFAT